MSSLPSVASASDPSSADLSESLHRQQKAFLSEMSPPRAVRIDRLNRLSRLIESHSEEFSRAIANDFGTRLRHGNSHHGNLDASERDSSCDSPFGEMDEAPACFNCLGLSAG